MKAINDARVSESAWSSTWPRPTTRRTVGRYGVSFGGAIGEQQPVSGLELVDAHIRV
ncbi:hypothetical protein [Streptomyces flaveolus]|uniref:hypothetical protein n=1 Tax=Streptomyces flaveolus TaxID=67297 RepID=UPI0036F78460